MDTSSYPQTCKSNHRSITQISQGCTRISRQKTSQSEEMWAFSKTWIHTDIYTVHTHTCWVFSFRVKCQLFEVLFDVHLNNLNYLADLSAKERLDSNETGILKCSITDHIHLLNGQMLLVYLGETNAFRTTSNVLSSFQNDLRYARGGKPRADVIFTVTYFNKTSRGCWCSINTRRVA